MIWLKILAFSETIPAQLKTPKPSEERLSSTPRNLLDSTWQTHLLLLPISSQEASRVSPEWAIWLKEYMVVMNKHKQGQKVLTKESFLNIKVHEGSVGWTKKGHHIQRHTHTRMPTYMHTCNPACTHTHAHTIKGGSPWVKVEQVEWTSSESHPAHLILKKIYKAVLLKF